MLTLKIGMIYIKRKKHETYACQIINYFTVSFARTQNMISMTILYPDILLGHSELIVFSFDLQVCYSIRDCGLRTSST